MINKKTKTIIITGSHHTPAIELIHQLKNDNLFNWNIVYVANLNSSETHLAKTIIPKLNIKFYPLNSGKLDRRFFPNNITTIPKTITAFFQSLTIINQNKPDIIISFGGYTSVPVILAGFFNRIPSITHEQTLTVSLSTKINSLFVKKVALSFEDHFKKLPKSKIVITGNLIRSDLSQNKSQKFQYLEKSLAVKPLIYITGGNQGSAAINQDILKILPDIHKTHTIIHQTGKINYQSVLNQSQKLHLSSNYIVTDYIDLEDIGWIFHHADIIISRSGANTCQEINVFNKKSILIPLPFTQQNEQLLNALWLKKLHPQSTIIIPQNKLAPKPLLKAISQLSASKTTTTVPSLSNPKLLQLIHELL